MHGVFQGLSRRGGFVLKTFHKGYRNQGYSVLHGHVVYGNAIREKWHDGEWQLEGSFVYEGNCQYNWYGIQITEILSCVNSHFVWRW